MKRTPFKDFSIKREGYLQPSEYSRFLFDCHFCNAKVMFFLNYLSGLVENQMLVCTSHSSFFVFCIRIPNFGFIPNDYWDNTMSCW